VSDEYHCVIAPLLSRLIRGEGRSKISDFLWYELEDHFGLDPAARDVDAMVNRLVAWWAKVGAELDALSVMPDLAHVRRIAGDAWH
jgi:hypothetical protein